MNRHMAIHKKGMASIMNKSLLLKMANNRHSTYESTSNKNGCGDGNARLPISSIERGREREREREIST